MKSLMMKETGYQTIYRPRYTGVNKYTKEHRSKIHYIPYILSINCITCHANKNWEVHTPSQSVGVRACESAIAHVRAEIQVRKGVRSLLELCVRSACVWGYLWSANTEQIFAMCVKFSKCFSGHFAKIFFLATTNFWTFLMSFSQKKFFENFHLKKTC